MRCLLRNKRPFWYAQPSGKTDVMDGDYLTGDKKIVYSEPVKVMGNISPARGSVYVDLFGNDINYEKVIVIDDPDTPIAEETVLCVDSEPRYNGDGDLIYDYIVRRVARSLNSASIAIARVNVG